MSFHLKYSAVTGHLLFGPNGHLVHTCAGEAVVCVNCLGDTPYQLTVVLSGIIIPAVCVPCLYGDHAIGAKKWIVLPSDVNTTYCLTQVGDDPCQWLYTEPSSARWGYWLKPNDSCEGDPDVSYDMTALTLLVEAHVGSIDLFVRVHDGPEVWNPWGHEARVFVGGTENTTCEDTHVPNNLIPESGCDQSSGLVWYYAGYDGTATISPECA